MREPEFQLELNEAPRSLAIVRRRSLLLLTFGSFACDGVEPGRAGPVVAALAAGVPPVSEPGALQPVPSVRCPEAMVLAEGQYCPQVEHHCREWLDPPGRFRRCARYEAPATCLVPTRPMQVCIDRDERTRASQRLPWNYVSFFSADRECARQGLRLCSESEWNFACEGENLRPYPYGFERDAKACNSDKTQLADGDGNLVDRRRPVGSHPRCASPFGVRDLAGNVEEFVRRDDRPDLPAMKGAHWLPGSNHCRARQIIHGARYAGVETGFRCCADPILVE